MGKRIFDLGFRGTAAIELDDAVTVARCERIGPMLTVNSIFMDDDS